MKLRNRVLIEIIKSLSSELGFTFTLFSQGWIILLEKGDRSATIYGNRFELNSSSACRIASNKAAISSLLKYRGIPCVPHELFLHPRMSGFIEDSGDWKRALEFAEKNNYDLVCKDNQGTGGNQVFRIGTQRELEKYFQEIHIRSKGLVLSPYFKIIREYRVIMLDGDILLSYTKEIPRLKGDGISSYGKLFLKALNKKVLAKSQIMETLSISNFDLDSIPLEGISIDLSWKHNIGNIASPKIINDKILLKKNTQHI